MMERPIVLLDSPAYDFANWVWMTFPLVRSLFDVEFDSSGFDFDKLDQDV